MLYKDCYRKFKERRQKSINELPMGFAFSNKQFVEMKEELGVKDNNELCSIGNGGFMKKTDVHLLEETMDKYDEEFKELMKDDEFLYSAFIYELANHEYCITFDPEDTLDELDLTFKDVINNKRLKRVFLKAEKEYLSKRDIY